MVIRIPKNKQREEIIELSNMCECTLKKEPTGDIFEFISQDGHKQSAKLMNWAIVTSVSFISNQLMHDWKFADVSKDDAWKAVETLTRILKELQRLI